MTGAGAPGAAGILRCLSAEPLLTIQVADANKDSHGRYWGYPFHQLPAGDDPGFEAAVLEICRKENIRLIMPLVTRELLPLARMRNQLAAIGTQVMVADEAAIEIANDKGKLYQFLEWRSIPVPAFRIIDSAEQFSSAITELGYPARPVCFKPCLANGSRGFRILDAAFDAAKALWQEKPGHPYLQPEAVLQLLQAGSFPELLIAEYLPGDEYSVDCIAASGECLIAVPRKRTRIVNGISAAGEFVQQEAIIAYCAAIIAALRLDGNIGIQVRQAASGEFLLLEINPRVQGTISAGLGAGINLPLLAVKLALGWPVAPEEWNVQWGTKFSRYWAELFYH